jgi:hypothetical protein
MKTHIRGIFLIAALILLKRTESAGQINQDVKYCQISASYSYNNDLYVKNFTLGKGYEKTADSLFEVCKVKYAFDQKHLLFLTDALNFFHTLGWNLVTVYTVPAVNPNLNRYYYILKRE